jgi:hypothetical protein
VSTKELCHTLQGISAGAYAALISWIQGYQYTQGGSENHQINSNDLFPVKFKVQNPGDTHLLRLPAVVSQTGSSVSFFLEEDEIRSSAWDSGCSQQCDDGIHQEFMNIRTILREKIERKKWILTDPLRSKGGQETFRRGALARAETPKKWYNKRAYREHPYWTDNLKYVC